MKIQERKVVNPYPTPTRLSNRNALKSGLKTTIASMLLTLGLVGGGFWFYQTRSEKFGDQREPTTAPNTNSSTVSSSAQNPTSSDVGSVQPALSGKAQVKILSAYRLQGKPDEVNVEMRVTRLAENGVEAEDLIDPAKVQARNPNTEEVYPVVNPFQQASNPIALSELRPEQNRNAYVALQVPPGVNAIDLFIPEVGTFRNIEIANSEVGNSSVSTTTEIIRETRSTPIVTPENGVPLPPPPVSREEPASKVKVVATGTQTQPSQLKNPDPIQANVSSASSINPAFGSQATVELLAVKRIKDPNSGKRDVVNVQMRIRRQSENTGFADAIEVYRTTARDLKTSQTYQPLGPANSTGTVFLRDIRPNASADAYVWLRVPETVNSLNLYIPETRAFENVPISN